MTGLECDSTHRVYRLYDFTKTQQISPHGYYCISGKVNSADKLYLVIESVKPDAKHTGLPVLLLMLKAREDSFKWLDSNREG